MVLDEYYGWLRRDFLQRLIDRTPLRVELKGSSIPFTGRTVIFTSNVDPPRWYKHAGLGALERRLAEPIGAVVYVGDARYPSASSYAATLPGWMSTVKTPPGPRCIGCAIQMPSHWELGLDSISQLDELCYNCQRLQETEDRLHTEV